MSSRLGLSEGLSGPAPLDLFRAIVDPVSLGVDHQALERGPQHFHGEVADLGGAGITDGLDLHRNGHPGMTLESDGDQPDAPVAEPGVRAAWPDVGCGRPGGGCHVDSINATFVERDGDRLLLRGIDAVSGALAALRLCEDHARVLHHQLGLRLKAVRGDRLTREDVQ